MTATKLFSVFLLTAFFFSLTHADEPNQFSLYDVGIILVLMSIAIGVEFFVACLIKRYRTTQNMVIAIFAVANILSVTLLLSSRFVTLPGYAIVLVLFMGWFILFTLLNMMDEYARVRIIIPSVVTVATMGIVATTFVSSMPPAVTANEPGMTSVESIRTVKFQTTPNVYFVGFDALIPKSLLKEYLGIDSTPYHEVLDTHFRSFRNFFADRVSTTQSLNSLLVLDIESFPANEARQRDYFIGHAPSPLLEIFKYNGYETNTLYRWLYLGHSKGPYVDNYMTYHKIGACLFQPGERRKYVYFGYCNLVGNPYFQSILYKLKISDSISDDDFLLKNIRAGLQKNTPQIFLAYIYSPGHTKKFYDVRVPELIEEYRELFIQGSKATADKITKIVDFIEKEDPDAILYVFGDHGAFLYKRAGYGFHKELFAEDSKRYIQDRFGVYGGIYPPDRCDESLSKPYSKDFMTISQGALMIIRCLTGGEEAFVTPLSYRLPGLGNESSNRYEENLYE